MKLILASLLLTSGAFAAIGDSAPTIPSTYGASGHPVLGAPSNAQLLTLWNGGSLPARVTTAANNWDSTCTSQNCTMLNFRYLLLAVRAAEAGGANMSASPYSTWKAKVMAMESLGPLWGQVYLSDDNASANCPSGSTCTVTDANVNFLTGCGGGSCAGKYFIYRGFYYTIQSVTDANNVVIQKVSAWNGAAGGVTYTYPFPNAASGLEIRVLASLYQTGQGIFPYAVMYDWMYADLSPAQRSYAANSLANSCQGGENEWNLSNYSPYNDQAYGNGANSWSTGPGQFAAAFAIYPDLGATALTHLRWAMDLLFNRMLPAWKQVMQDGGWHEAWNDYQIGNGTIAMHSFITTVPLMWANASGKGVAYTFGTTCGSNCAADQFPWLKNWAYQMMYGFRPDFVPIKIGDTQPLSDSECLSVAGAPVGALNGLAEIYSDPVLRGWARLVNGNCMGSGVLDGNEPTSWPYYTPDNNSNATSDRSSLPLCRNFTGWGELICRSGWGEDDTWFALKYGDSFWSHPHFDAGHFDIFNRGYLAIDSGTYHAGSYSHHLNYYAKQTVAHNSILIRDPNDSYSSQLSQVMLPANGGSITCEVVPNDGGQRRIGSGWQTYWATAGCGGPSTNTLMNSPADQSAWYRGREYFHRGTLLAFAQSPNATNPAYVYIAVDITAAYNNSLSGSSFTIGGFQNGYGTSNRSPRAQKVVRHVVFIPRGHAAYVVVFDQVTSTQASFLKKWLLHSINQPVITGNQFTIQRTENALNRYTPGTWPGGFMVSSLTHDNTTCAGHVAGTDCYQYGGQLVGWAVGNNLAALTSVGGAGHEFDDGTGTNRNDCQYSIVCADGADTYGLGNTGAGCAAGTICPTAAAAPFEPGAWRIEETPASAAQQDWFLNVMFASAVAESNLPTAPVPRSGGTGTTATLGAQWTDTNCTYTVDFYKTGVGGTVTIQGSGCATQIN